MIKQHFLRGCWYFDNKFAQVLNKSHIITAKAMKTIHFLQFLGSGNLVSLIAQLNLRSSGRVRFPQSGETSFRSDDCSFIPQHHYIVMAHYSILPCQTSNNLMPKCGRCITNPNELIMIFLFLSDRPYLPITSFQITY